MFLIMHSSNSLNKLVKSKVYNLELNMYILVCYKKTLTRHAFCVSVMCFFFVLCVCNVAGHDDGESNSMYVG